MSADIPDEDLVEFLNELRPGSEMVLAIARDVAQRNEELLKRLADD